MTQGLSVLWEVWHLVLQQTQFAERTQTLFCFQGCLFFFFNVAMAATVPELRANEEMNVSLPDFVFFFKTFLVEVHQGVTNKIKRHL